MHHLISVVAARLPAVLVTLGIVLVACSPASSEPAASNGGPGSSAGASEGAQASSGASAAGPGASVPGGVDVQGSLVSSGIYDATWTWEAGLEAGPGIGGITLTSDKGTFGSIQVLADASIIFTSGAPELSGNGSYAGSGAQVHLKDLIPCGFTLDNDVTGSTDGAVLHLTGTLTIIGGVFNC